MSLLIKLFFAGFGSCILVLVISGILELFLPFMKGSLANKSFIETLLYAFVGVALVEEFSKWFMTYTIGYHHREFDELYDGIVYAIFVSLGFAFIENILYVIQTASINTALLRAISAVPSHACDAIFMGYYLSMAKQYSLKGNKDAEQKNVFYSVLIPAILHGIYDFCLMSGYMILVAVFLVFVIFLYILSLKKLKALSKNNKKIKFKNKFCQVCGKAVTGEFCSRCGTRQV
ncbi:MAG: PrsW family intramembrane metalloprotease [Bacilli bacterium]|nr:PrsW family intramembrane metalloprotease [Bacilli bacterium]